MTVGMTPTLLALAAALAMAWWPQQPSDVEPPERGEGVGPWERRLEALGPADPMAYFELAEEVADSAADEGERALARRLFGIAGALDPQRLGRSACLALADLEPVAHARRRLLALAALLDERGGGPAEDQPGGADALDPVAALAVSEAFGHYRRGNGARALRVLEKPGAMDLLEAWGGAVFRGGSAGFLEDCWLYRSSRRPVLKDQDRMGMLRFEAAVLAGANRSWSGDLLLNEGRPLIEVDPDHIEDVLGVNADRPCYRSGRWHECD
jgi:hypothetical protein